MSLKSKIEAVIYASEEPVTLQQLVGLLAGEAQSELEAIAADQAKLPLGVAEQGTEISENQRDLVEAGTDEAPEAVITPATETAATGEIASAGEDETVAAEEPAETQSEADQDGSNTQTETTSDEQPAPEQVSEGASQGDTPEASGPTEAAGSTEAPNEPAAELDPEEEKRRQRDHEKAIRDHIRRAIDTLIREYAESDRGIEIREVASGFRMGTKPEYHDAVRGFVKSLKPPLKLTLPALETLAVVAYKQPVTAAEISEIRGVDSAGVLGGLMTRKLIATAGRKQVIGRPMLYKTTRDFLLRFGLKDINELPSMEEFERMAGELAEQEDLPMESTDAIIEEANARGDAEMLREANATENPSDESAEAVEAETEEADATEGAASDESNEAETTAVDDAEATVETAADEEPAKEVAEASTETTEPQSETSAEETSEAETESTSNEEQPS